MALGTAIGVRESSFSSVRRYFDMAADRISLHPEMRRLLSVPFREIAVELPLRRDDQRLQLFRGYRVQHNGVRGPVIGPVRFQPGLEMETLRAAAESMTWRCAAANVPFGGAAGGLACDTNQLSCKELERLVRRYANRIHSVLGIYHDVCAPGPNAGTEVMSWISDEYSSLQKGTLTAVLGKPFETGGLPERDKVAGRALARLAQRAAEEGTIPVSGMRVAIASLDRSALWTALALAEAGCVIVGIKEERGGLRCSTGIDLEAVIAHLKETDCYSGFVGAAETSEVHTLDCDLLILGAAEGTLNSASGATVRAKQVIESAELAITPAADRTLNNRDVVVIPDLVGAAGAVLAANVEWSNNVQHVASEEARLYREVELGLLRTFNQVREKSLRDKTGMRLAAYTLAVERVARCERLRVVA